MAKRHRPGLWFGVAALLLLGASALAPDVLKIPDEYKPFAFLAFVVLAIAATLRGGQVEERDAPDTDGRKSYMISIIGMVVSGLIFIGFFSWHFWPSKAPTQSQSATSKGSDEHRQPLTMTELYYSDFPGVGRTYLDLKIGGQGIDPVGILCSEFWDISTNSYFFSFYPKDAKNIRQFLRLFPE
ncbi:MAG TPA: hypothetical protein VH722_03190, partial [Alphaproteobacteria bacterium]|nr:hypothetical protein [Alphaproteobacteria bacterium]